MLVILQPFINAMLKLANVAVSGLGVVAAGIGGIFKGDSAGFEKALERAAKARESFLSDPFGSIVPAAPRSVTGPRTGRLATVSEEAAAAKASREDPRDAILARMDDIVSSGRGIEPARIIADSLAAIGGGGNSVLVGRGQDEQKRLLQQQLSALQKIDQNTRKLDGATLR
jgi:dihydroxyacetone kinase